jgi:hypothetical protein
MAGKRTAESSGEPSAEPGSKRARRQPAELLVTSALSGAELARLPWSPQLTVLGLATRVATAMGARHPARLRFLSAEGAAHASTSRARVAELARRGEDGRWTIQCLVVNELTPEQRARLDSADLLAAAARGKPPARWRAEDAEDLLFMTEAVRREPGALRFASAALRDDLELVAEAVARRPSALSYAGDRARSDKAVVLRAVEAHGEALLYGAEALRADKDVMLAAVRTFGPAFRYASDELRADRDVALAAIATSWRVVQYVGGALREDGEVLAAAEAGAAAGLAPRDSVRLLMSGRDAVLDLLRQARSRREASDVFMRCSNAVRDDPVVRLAAAMDQL